MNLTIGFVWTGCCCGCFASGTGIDTTVFACGTAEAGTADVWSLDGRYRTAVIDLIEPSSDMVWVFPSEKLKTTESARLIALDERRRITGRIIFKIFIGV